MDEADTKEEDDVREGGDEEVSTRVFRGTLDDVPDDDWVGSGSSELELELELTGGGVELVLGGGGEEVEVEVEVTGGGVLDGSTDGEDVEGIGVEEELLGAEELAGADEGAADDDSTTDWELVTEVPLSWRLAMRGMASGRTSSNFWPSTAPWPAFHGPSLDMCPARPNPSWPWQLQVVWVAANPSAANKQTDKVTRTRRTDVLVCFWGSW